MNTTSNQARAIFLEAIEQESPENRAHFIVHACEGDPDLRANVERLLRSHELLGSFHDAPPSNAATVELLITEKPGNVIGPYKLLQQIGEGGMGIVFMAEQTEPIQRTVALKIIKPGMDTRQVIARFEAERQALAMMDHPNIAKVLDAGTTGGGSRDEGLGTSADASLALDSRLSTLGHSSGRPYFVMELVKGVPITKYCDEKQLSLRERLNLFLSVCQAVQHAHQKGIIHRDIKPTNVIVAEYDNQAVPKVIDFGVAKATAHRLTERTMFTEFGQVLGTMEYMSPEQSKFNQLDIDTRSDIYSLGVMLYELLAGSTPFEGKRLHEAAFDEMLRIIREEEPPKPSTRISSIDTLPSVAANRHTEPARLSKDVRGELDWIVMKALEKDRNRRYETASGFAADIERHLHDKPVEAGPPSAAYRFRKFAKRNRTTLAAGALLAMSLVVALGGIAGGIGWVMRDRTARQARVTGQLELILDEVARLEKEEKWHDALVSAQRAEPALAAGEAAPDIQERARQALADLEFVRRLDEIRAESGTVWGSSKPGETMRSKLAVQAEQEYAATFREAGIDVDTLSVEQAAKRIAARREIAAAVFPALDDWVAVRSKVKDEATTRRLIDVLRTADPDPWRQRVRDALGRRDWPALENLANSPDLDRQPAATISFLYAALREQAESDIDTPGQVEGDLGPRGFFIALEMLRRAQRKYPNDFWINHRLGVDLIWCQSPDVVVAEGLGFMRAAVAVRPESGHAMMNLGNGYASLKNDDEAIACFRRAIELTPESWTCHSNLASALVGKGLHEEAIAAYEQAIKVKPNGAVSAYARLAMLLSNCPDAHLRNPLRAVELANKATQLVPNAGDHWTALGVARYRAAQWQAARTALDRSLELGTGGWGGGNFAEKEAIDWLFLAMSYWQMGEHDQANQCYVRALEWMDKQLTHKEQLLRFRAEAEELLKIVDERKATEAVDTRGAVEAFAELGTLRVRQGNFRDAATDYAKAIELEPASEFVWFQGGSLLAHLGYRESFRKHCAATLERFGDTQDRDVAERTAKLMSCVPTDFSGMDPQRIAVLADRAVASGANHQNVQWFHLAKGMADYRAGHFDSVVLSMQKARTPHWPVRTVLADLYLAMAQFQLGDREASVKTLDGAVAMMMTLPQPGRDDLGEHFHDYLFCRLARREAEALILNPAREPTTSKDHNDSADEAND